MKTPSWRARRAVAAATLLALMSASLCAATLESARAAADRRDFAAALPAYATLLNRDPGNADLLIEAARVNGFADRNAEAAALYRRVLLVAPTRRGDVLPSLAWQTLWSPDPVAATLLFEELSRDGSDAAVRADAFDGLGQAREVSGDGPGAVTAWRAALAAQPGRPGVERRLARRLLWDVRHDEALAVLRAALARDPDARDAAWLLATVQNDAGQHFRAVQAYRRLGAPRDGGETADLARAWAWSGFEDRAHALLTDSRDPALVRWRDTRLGRELRPWASATLEHAIDRDRLEVWNTVLAAGWQPSAGASAELRVRRLALTDAIGSPGSSELQGSWRLRRGEPGSEGGVWFPAFGLRAADWGDWTPITGFARVTWLPVDRWRVDAEVGRELIETPQAIAARVSVDTAALGIDHRPHPRLSLALGLATLRFDDGNRRQRMNGRVEWLISSRPRWTVGADAMRFSATQPTGPAVAGRGYWNPDGYHEVRAFTGLTIEQHPWDASMRVGLGTATETDGFGNRSRGKPNFWELTAGLDAGPSARLRATLGGAGGGFGVGGASSGYWRRYATLSVNAWF
jgi:tetratricopeptide (TPR) repeat protein